MAFTPSQVQLSPAVVPAWGGRAGSSVLIYNPDPANTIYLGGQSGISVGATNTLPLGPGQSVVVDGSQAIYGCAPAGTAATVVIPDGAAFFLGLTAGQGKLAIDQIQSPNFDLANPPASPPNSWALLKSGLAYFFGVVLSGGTLTGPDFILNTTGMYSYSGTPAAGNLISSVGVTAGTMTDPTGHNAVFQGDTDYSYNIGHTTVTALQKSGGELSAWTAATQAGPYTLVSQVIFDTGGNVTVGTGDLRVVNTATFGGEYVIYPPSGDATGATDGAALNAAAAAGQVVQLVPGTYYTSQTIAYATAGAGLLFPPGAKLAAAVGFAPDTSGCIIDITADSVTISHPALDGLGATAAGQCGGISVTGAAHVRITDPYMENLSWCGIAPQASAGGTPCVDLMVTSMVIRSSAAAARCLSNSVANDHGEYFITTLQMQQMGATSGFGANLDGVLLEDIEDILIGLVNGGIVAGSGAGIHVTGACDGIVIGFVDVGTNVAAGSGPPILIDTTAAASPGYVCIAAGVVQGGAQGVAVTTGAGGVANTALVELGLLRSHKAWGSGFLLASNATVLLTSCVSETANQSGAAGVYDYDCSGMTAAGTVELTTCLARTPIGAGAGNVTAAAAVTSQVYVEGCKLLGTGTTPSNALSGTPRWVKSTAPVNPRGSIAAPAITVGTFTPSASQYDLMIVFDTIGGMTDFQIGGTSVGVVPAAGAGFFVGARETVTVVSAGSAPTWKWFAN